VAIITRTRGDLLGIAMDGEGRLHICDVVAKAVLMVTQDGHVSIRSRGTPAKPLRFPNHPVFDADGNLYVSDSGDYWCPQGDGCIFVVRPGGKTEVFHAGPFRFPNGVAIDPSGRWLYVAQSAAWNVVRIPLDRPHGAVEVVFALPPHTIPDGMVFAETGELIVACYRPDAVWVCGPGPRCEPLLEDRSAELLLAPTNVFLHGGNLFIANLAGRHISVCRTDLKAARMFQPSLGYGEEQAPQALGVQA
jgi:sugar lactone lactonase YvrE